MYEGEIIKTLTPPTKTNIIIGAADRMVAKEVGRSRQNYGLGGWGNICEVSHWHPQEKVGSAIGAHRPYSPTCP